jgi:hypothetical protein
MLGERGGRRGREGGSGDSGDVRWGSRVRGAVELRKHEKGLGDYLLHFGMVK